MARGLTISKPYAQRINLYQIFVFISIYSTMTPDILFHNHVLLIIIDCLRYFNRTEDLKRFVSVWSCEKFCSFVFSLLSGKRKTFTRRSAFYAHMVDQIISGLQN